MMIHDLVLVGRVARTHGNRGQVIVNLETDFAEERFKTGRVLYVGPEGVAVARRIREVRFHQGRPIVALEGIETMNAAEDLAGSELWVNASDVDPLPENTYYHRDLIGCEAVDRRGEVIGRVTAVEGPIDRSHLIVEGRAGEVMIPLVAGIATVDVAARRVVVDPPAGLLELNENRHHHDFSAHGAGAARGGHRRAGHRERAPGRSRP